MYHCSSEGSHWRFNYFGVLLLNCLQNEVCQDCLRTFRCSTFDLFHICSELQMCLSVFERQLGLPDRGLIVLGCTRSLSLSLTLAQIWTILAALLPFLPSPPVPCWLGESLFTGLSLCCPISLLWCCFSIQSQLLRAERRHQEVAFCFLLGWLLLHIRWLTHFDMFSLSHHKATFIKNKRNQSLTSFVLPGCLRPVPL